MSHQIRAHYDAHAITVYQAYSSAIALPAVNQQLLSASSSFKHTRMTWIKPSWCWMMYRSGYSYKDPRQECILALRVRRSVFEELLATSVLSSHQSQGEEEKERGERVRIQWDPERGPRLERLEERSIQVGIPAGLSKKWVEEAIVGIEDVTERAREMKRVVDEEGDVGVEQLVQRELMPVERIYELPDDIAKVIDIMQDTRRGGS
ncbi:MAG: hypothetical protein MMC23_002848 [Stictis urceolatum]|nr:hypothetical protein [Stictis urceolata]